MIVAIDGPAGAGKSSIAKKCAAAFSFRYINSGLLYRILTLKALAMSDPASSMSDSVSSMPDPASSVDAVLRDITAASLRDLYLQYTADPDLHRQCYLATIDDQAGAVSSFPRVRQVVNEAIGLLEHDHDCIVEGRDITSVVHRDADLKIYLDADIQVRAQRRSRQRDDDYRAVLHSMRIRDRADYERPTGKLTITKNVHKIDVTHLTFSEVYDIVSQCIVRILREQRT